MAKVRLFRSRLARGVFALAVVVTVGITGYMVIEGWSLLDAAYMTILTFTTVGYEEVHPLSSAGRIFTIFLMVTGVGACLTSGVGCGKSEGLDGVSFEQ